MQALLCQYEQERKAWEQSSGNDSGKGKWQDCMQNNATLFITATIRRRKLFSAQLAHSDVTRARYPVIITIVIKHTPGTATSRDPVTARVTSISVLIS